MFLAVQIRELFTTTNDLIKFAEAKIAALIAFNGAVILGVLKMISDMQGAPWFIYYLIFVLAMNVVSAFIMIAALSPQMVGREHDVEPGQGTNLLYFGSIAKLKPEHYIERLKSRYQFQSQNETYELDLARELIIVCQIAVRKFRLFRLATAWTFAGITTPVGILVYSLFFDPLRKQPKG